MRRLPLIAMVSCLVAGPAVLPAATASAQGATPEVEACQASGLIALKERVPGLKDIVIDATTLSQSKADTKVGDTAVKTVILGEAALATAKAEKPRKFVCLIGEKGKVLLTFFMSP